MTYKGWYAIKQRNQTKPNQTKFLQFREKIFRAPWVNIKQQVAQSAGAVEYTNCFSAEG